MKKGNHKRIIAIQFILILIGLAYYGDILNAQAYTRGIGLYPGNTKEDFSPTLQIDKSKYHNLSLNKPAYHSSSYDYNHTAQLITDGIRDTVLPEWITVSTSQQAVISKNERESLMDRNMMSAYTMEGQKVWVQYAFHGKQVAKGVDSISITGSILVDELEGKGWSCIIQGSADGITWTEAARTEGTGNPGTMLPEAWSHHAPKNMRLVNFSVLLPKPVNFKFYRAELAAPNVLTWRISELTFFDQKQRIELGGPYKFTSAWMSGGNKEEWVYVDLGASCTIDHIVLFWIRQAAEGVIQVSENATDWKDVVALSQKSGRLEEFKLTKPSIGRYLRILMKQPTSPNGYILSEIEVYGLGGPTPIPAKSPVIQNDGRLDLAGGNWILQRSSLVAEKGEVISKNGYFTRNWLIATVPATTLVSYLNAGAIPDPNYSDNQSMISESFFYSDFWYRTEFTAPATYKGKHSYLNFDGINWKAEIYLNGKKIGRIEGAFTKGVFDVTGILLPGQKNSLAVKVEKNATPGFVTEQTKWSPDPNGGELGADNPTFHASVGWDWIPTIRGRNTGIYNDVYLTTSKSVTIENPFFKSDLPLPDTTQADISIEVTLKNHDNKSVTGILKGSLGLISFEQNVTLKANESSLIKLDKNNVPVLHITNPTLWWPNGYGQSYLYNLKLEFVTTDNQVSDSKSLEVGIREVSYSEENEVLKIFVNGKRFVGRGGNWGFAESMLRYREREYDIAVRYHKEMNFNLIRNWVGQIPDEEFYNACDKFGIMIWQDFWLANPLDGPNPNDNNMFMQNAEDMVLRIRNHPSMVLYCGRNEGNPPDAIDTALRSLIKNNHPDLHYISNSAWGVVSGGGPYRAMPTKFYFENRATPKLHSELGMPNITNLESFKEMMPDSSCWPQSNMWGIHDFCLNGAQGGKSFNERMEQSFGKIDDFKVWVELAQWINYEGYRAMFEAQGKNRMGMLLWMSHPAWPSLVWQTYDYYFDPTAAYFGCKKASEPLHIQWNQLTDSIEVVNYSSNKGAGLTATIELLNLNGKVKWEQSAKLTCMTDNITRCFNVKRPVGLDSVYFMRLKLKSGNDLISENFYWVGLKEGSYKAIRNLPKVELQKDTQVKQVGTKWILTTVITNPANTPVLMTHIKVIREKTGDRILPAIYSDNYISLMPGEKRTVTIEIEEADTRGEKPLIVLDGYTTKEE